MRKRTYILGSISILILLIGTILKNLHMAGAHVGIVLGLGLFGLGFCPSFLFDKWTIEPSKESRRSYLVLFLAIELITLSSLATILRLPGSPVMGYLSLFTFAIYVVFFTRHTEGRQLTLTRSRQLACVVFTDIVGFTEMMGNNEEMALKVLEQNRSIQKKALRKYRGRLIKELGDGTLVIFYTAYEAFQFAVSVQEKTKKNGSFSTRIGMHVSEILFTDDDVFGDGVNVASRIAGVTNPDEICFSQSVFQNIKNKEEIGIRHIGPTNLKGVDYPLDLYSLKA